MAKANPNFIGQKVVVNRLYPDDLLLNSELKMGQEGIVVRVLSRKDYGNDRLWIYVTRDRHFYSVSPTQVTPCGKYSYSQINRIIKSIESTECYTNERELVMPLISNLNKAKKVFKMTEKENESK